MGRWDRQIRLWGEEGQRRLATASVLLGHVEPVSMEVAKNLVISGLGRCTIVDPRPASQDFLDQVLLAQHQPAQYQLAQHQPCRASLAKEDLAPLNPDCKCTCMDASVSSLPESFFAPFDLIVLSIPFGCSSERPVLPGHKTIVIEGASFSPPGALPTRQPPLSVDSLDQAVLGALVAQEALKFLTGSVTGLDRVQSLTTLMPNYESTSGVQRGRRA